MIEIKECMKAVGRLTLLKFFPADPIAHAELAKLFQRMIEKPFQLDWLVDTLINHVGEWPGPKEVRGLICSRWKPLDGIETFTSLSGFSPADCEARNLEQSERYKQLDSGDDRSATMLRASHVAKRIGEMVHSSNCASRDGKSPCDCEDR